MRVLVVYCHPNKASFSSALHDTVIESLSASGHDVTDLDLYGEGFDPVLNVRDRANYGDVTEYVKSVERYARQLASAEGFVLVYPAWWYGMPAMLKGYFDRVWAPGIAYDVKSEGGVDTSRLAHIRRLAVVTTYGSSWWLVRPYMGDPARKVIARGVRQLCAKDHMADWLVLYNIDGATQERRARFLARVRRKMARW